ncbi:hypothetical protein C9J01_10255 [Photobacterium rosenbergii]|uniref:Uncharacterized protein n=1 Tax=Photobacterium rosenbergii TaxID=294936 RepID=A0A2T3NF60_9GAMM|nr:hypothetical protein [Photobacterium rosenbergii]PSW13228.1 hypothetical protein C9J01_10255 [Photobacterium rosenbergii]
MNIYTIVTKNGETKATEPTTDAKLYWEEKGWTYQKDIEAKEPAHAIDAYLRGSDSAESTMTHGYALEDGKLEQVDSHRIGYGVLVLGVVLALFGMSELGDYRPDMDMVSFLFTGSALCEVVAIIMIIIGHVNSKTV